MEFLFDASDEKRARWVTPTLTMIHLCSASAGGSAAGITEGGHVYATLVHSPISSTTSSPGFVSSPFVSTGDGAASS